MKLNRESASLAPRRIGFDSRHLHSVRLRSVSGKHAPVVRPKCGFESCRRLLPTPVAQWTERCPATAAAAGSTPAGRTPHSSRGRSSDGRAPGFHPGEARSNRVVRSLKARGVTQRGWRALTSPVRVRILAGLFLRGRWCNSSIASSNLAGPGANPGRPVLHHVRRGPERLGYLWAERPSGCAVRSRASDRTPRPRRCVLAAGQRGSGYRLLIDRSQVRVLPGALRAPVAQLAEQFRSAQPRPQQTLDRPVRGPEHRRLSVRAPGACVGRSACSSRARSSRSVAQCSSRRRAPT